MSIIYQALKKAEGNGGDIPSKKAADNAQGFTKEGQKIKYKAKADSISFILKSIIILAVLSGSFLIIKVVMVDKELPIKKRMDTALKLEGIKTILNAKANKYKDNIYALEGIIYDKGEPSAIINGKTLKEAQTIDSFLIQKISRDKVLMVDSENNSSLILSF